MYSVQSKMDSFIQTFKNLCRAGKDATLSFSSTAGKVEAKLSVDLGMLPALQRHPYHHHQQRGKQPRNGPAQQRRREQRAKARALAAAEAVQDLPKEEARMLELAEEATKNLESSIGETTVDGKGEKVITVEVNETPADEFCPENEKEAEEADRGAAEYTFVSEYHEDDVVETLEELFPVGSFELLLYVVAPNPAKSADRDCIVSLKKTPGQSIIWPEMNEDQAAVIREVSLK